MHSGKFSFQTFFQNYLFLPPFFVLGSNLIWLAKSLKFSYKAVIICPLKELQYKRVQPVGLISLSCKFAFT